MKSTDSKRYIRDIQSKALTEYAIKVRLEARLGDEHPGWAKNNAAFTITEALKKNGIMVDRIDITDCMEVQR